MVINLHHDVVVIVHNGKGTQIDREYRTHQFDAIDDPLAAVRKVKSSGWVSATQKGTPDASGDAVVVRCILNGHLAVSGFWHIHSLVQAPVDQNGKWHQSL
jgi:hypothetical protein